MADYPDSVYSPRTKENRSGVVYDAAKKSVIFVEDISKLDAEVVAIETELGANPKGGHADVAARLDALVPASIFDKFLDFIHWQDPDAFDHGAEAIGDVAFNCPSIELVAGFEADQKAYVKTNGMYEELIEEGKLLTIEFFIPYYGTTVNCNVWLLGLDTFSNPPADNDKAIGFIIRNGTIYGHCGTGAAYTETTTGVTLPQNTQHTRLRLVFNPGTDCKFYVNDVLKCTIDTNLPAAFSMKIYACIQNKADDLAGINVGRVLIEKEY